MMQDYIIELDKPRTFRFGFRSIRLLRKQLGNKSMEELMGEAIEQMPVFVWAGLIWEDKALTVEQVEQMLDEKIPGTYTMMDVVTLVTEAMTAHLGVKTEALPKDGGAPAGPFVTTGTTSGTPDESPLKSD